MKNGKKMLREKLLERALELARSGISVIPVQGDSSAKQPKRPAIKWRAWQRRRMSAEELRHAFAGDAAALGIVCGRVSELVVVDFDDHLRYRRFCRQLPELSESYTVKTRRGYHVYFRTSERVPSHQFDGGDIKGERSYVVAPPSVIAGVAYARAKKVAALRLEKTDIERLLNYFHAEGVQHPMAMRTGAVDVDVSGLYKRLAPVIGRNQALYRAASVARDRGIGIADVQRQLNALHALEAPRLGHKPESYRDRVREAQATVGSAFSRGRGFGGMGMVANSVREKLLSEQRSAAMPRLLDAIAVAGWQAEAWFKMSDAVELGARYGLNRKTVMAALTGEQSIFDGRHIIARRYVEYLDIGGLKSPGRGRRPELIFQTPSPGRLLRAVNVGWSPSDCVTAADLKSAREYRLALHREYIRRVSPMASLRVLADRLGVDERTVRRYNAVLGVKARARVACCELSWERLFCLPTWSAERRRRVTAGYWLETRDGYRAPAWRHIGMALLRRGETGLKACMRRVSEWRLSGEASVYPREEAVTAAEFARLRAVRDGEPVQGLARRALGRLWNGMKALAGGIAYDKVRLRFESVAARIAEDKIADSIAGYLFARDEKGKEVRRPARRGIAYRMLKEFGDGNVFLALRQSPRDGLGAVVEEAARSMRLGGALA